MPLDYSSLSRLGFKSDRPADEPTVQREKTGVAFTEKMKGYYVFHDVAPEDMESVLSRSTIRTFAPGEAVLQENEDCNAEAYVIMSGKVSVSVADDVFAVLQEGDLFWEYALIAWWPCTATVRALEAIECLVLDEDACLDLSDKNGSINEIMLKRIEENMAKGRGVFAEPAREVVK